MATPDDTTKRCPKCGETKPRVEFKRDRRRSSGVRSRCRACENASRSARRKLTPQIRDPEKAKARNARRRKSETKGRPPFVPTDQDRELVRSLTAALVPQREIRQRLSKPVSIITFRKHFREEIGVQPPSGIYWEKPQPGQTIYAANKKMLLARELARRKAKPELFIALSSKRRARKRAAVGTFTAADITDIRRLQRDKCAACRRPLRGKGDIDHIIALSGGGSNDRRNLQLLCHSCNSSKQARHPIEFMQSRGFLI